MQDRFSDYTLVGSGVSREILLEAAICRNTICVESGYWQFIYHKKKCFTNFRLKNENSSGSNPTTERYRKKEVPSSPVNSRCCVPFAAVATLLLQWRFPIEARSKAKMTYEPPQWCCCDINRSACAHRAELFFRQKHLGFPLFPRLLWLLFCSYRPK